MKTTIKLSGADRENAANELAKILADEYVLFTKTKHAHCNQNNAESYDKHKFFETQSDELNTMIDSVAERIRSLGHYVDAMLKAFLSVTRCTEQNRNKNQSHGFMKELLSDHEKLIVALKGNVPVFANDYKDAETSNFLSGLVENHEKMAWFLRTHLN
ncbi:DNA starvation/stationary phase protection protein [Flavobacterium noncentrifugens]|uniref:Starvation-inducible DNA-binding protein n=1 Tax=Flavobacterium noncentrifugens TaxID=1128970 RepID=A0A1G8WUP3_9FLAO|nr:DNA starvation/stationary phase protection protein [Flavobacterium noncentrifugens]GEP51064.1 DNA starvation/stationary phase protection protein [Flavobacterium noncentrifugens]SDJ82132.1 starvation-inducible DNA-binding protein [Flavobacterium noncentrifugens]